MSVHHSATIRAALLAAASFVPITAAWADEDTAATASTEAAGESEAADVPIGEDSEILVTARRRTERAQDVPIALTAVSGDTLERSGNLTLTQIQQLTPSLVVTGGNARNTYLNIRGLGSNANNNDGLEIGVGFYIDDVYYGRVGQSQFDLIDIERVEVLRGPQGTLFGKNTTAGAVNIATRAPTFDPEFRGEASLGEDGYHQVRGSVSVPLVDERVAFRLSVSDTHKDGLTFNRATSRWVNDYDNFSVRGQLLIKPTDAITVRLIGDYSRQTSESVARSALQVFGYDNGTAINNNFAVRAARVGYVPPANDPWSREVDLNGVFQANMEGYGVSGKVDWDLGAATLSSITAYRWWDWYPLNDQDGTSLDINTKGGTTNWQRQFSQELRLASNGERRLSYVVGLYYFWQVIHGLGQYQLGSQYGAWNNHTYANPTLADYAYSGFQSNSIIEPVTRSYAAFGQATWKATDALSITGGLRVTHEKKTGLFDQYTAAGNDLSLLSPADRAAAQALRDAVYPNVRYETGLSDTALTGQVTVSYKAAPDILLYGTYSHGSKSGGLSLGTLPAGVSPVVRPEKVNTFEIGLKSQFWDRRVTFNAAAYHTEITDYQAAITEQIGNTTSSRRYIANIPKVRSLGFEADLTLAPTEHLRLTASVAYNEATYRDYKNAQQAPERRYLGEIQDLTGQPLANAPKFSWSVSGDFWQPFFGGEVYLRADYSHRSSFYADATNSRYSLVPGYGLLNARIGFRDADAKWDFSLWARNLTDTQYYTSLGASNLGLQTALLGDPRQAGATFRVQF